MQVELGLCDGVVESKRRKNRTKNKCKGWNEKGGNVQADANETMQTTGFQAFLGRVLFSAVFLSAGINKAQELWSNGGVQTMQYMKPKLDALAVQLAETVGQAAPLATLAQYYQYLLVAACVMEIVGPLMFMLGSDHGARIMALFLAGVTPIMHNFWNAQGMEKMIEMIMFMKVSRTTRTHEATARK